MIMNIYICRYIQLVRQVYERFSHMLTTFDRLGDLTYYLPPHTPHYTHYITTVVVLATTHVHAHASPAIYL